MRRLATALLFCVLAAVQAGCESEERPVTRKVAGYDKRLTAADIIFVDDPKFYERGTATASGSIRERSDLAPDALEAHLTDYARRIATELPPRVNAAGITGQVRVIARDALKNTKRDSATTMVIMPVGGTTACKPCYSVVQFRVSILEPGQKQPSWSSDVKAVVSKDDGVDQLWNGTLAALRADGLVAGKAQ